MWTRRYMWVEFVVGSRPCSEGFSPGSLVFLPPQKTTLLNFNSIGNSRATGLSVARLLRGFISFIFNIKIAVGEHIK